MATYPDPFSLSVMPEAPKIPEEPSPPILQPAQQAQTFSAPSFSAEPPVSPATPLIAPELSIRPSHSEAEQLMSPKGESMEDLEEEAAKKTALTIVFGVLIVLAFAGVGVWYFFLRDSGMPLLLPTPGPQEEPERELNLIVATLGGKIVMSDGASITIPAGALSQDTKLEILKVENGEVTDLYELKPTGLKFAKPVTIEIPYKQSGSPYHIILEYWKDEGEKKRALKYTVDKKEKKLRTLVKEF